ncbi:MAG: ankyrin repeat domain-containing protein, partial [Gemmatimonadales bacterium]
MPTLVTSVVRGFLVVASAVIIGQQSAHAQQAESAGTPQEQLWDAARAGDTLALGPALVAGARIDSLDVRRNLNGRRALNWAAWDNHPDAIRFLVAHGARVNAWNRTGFTALHHAAENGSLEAALALLQAGADPAAPNKVGQTPAEV